MIAYETARTLSRAGYAIDPDEIDDRPADPFAEAVRSATRGPVPVGVSMLLPKPPTQYRPKGMARTLVTAILDAEAPIDSPRLAKLIDRPASDVLELLAAAERARLVRRTRSARGFYQWESA